MRRTDLEYASLSLSPNGTGAIKGDESKRRMRPLGAKAILLSLQEIDPNSMRAAGSLSSRTSSNSENSFPGKKKSRITNTTKTSTWHSFNSSEDFKQVPLVSKIMPSPVIGEISNEDWVRFEEKERSANPRKGHINIILKWVQEARSDAQIIRVDAIIIQKNIDLAIAKDRGHRIWTPLSTSLAPSTQKRSNWNEIWWQFIFNFTTV